MTNIYGESYTAVADIVFVAGFIKIIFVEEVKVKRDTATIGDYLTVWL